MKWRKAWETKLRGGSQEKRRSKKKEGEKRGRMCKHVYDLRVHPKSLRNVLAKPNIRTYRTSTVFSYMLPSYCLHTVTECVTDPSSGFAHFMRTSNG